MTRIKAIMVKSGSYFIPGGDEEMLLDSVHLRMVIENGELRLGRFVFVGSDIKSRQPWFKGEVPWGGPQVFHRFERRDTVASH